MVPVYVFLSLLGLGYYINEQGVPRKTQNIAISKKRMREELGSVNAMKQNEYTRAKNYERKVVSKAFQGAKDNRDPNVPLNYNEGILNTKGNLKKELPLNDQTIADLNENKSKEQFVFSQLTGEYVKKDNFKHNNMEPFFKSCSYGQSYKDNDVNEQKLGTFTGSDKYYKSKSSMPANEASPTPLFKPEETKTTTWGQSNSLDRQEQYYNQSMYRNNELPFKKTYVGSGLNKGYTSKPSGGFHDPASQNMVRPKTVDELRPLNNPKLSYEGRVKPGSGTAQRGKVGQVGKYKASKFYLNSADRYFTTVGSNEREQLRPQHIIKQTDRGKKNYEMGPAKFQTDRESKRGLTRKSSKITFKTDSIRNVDGQNFWDVKEDFSNYGKNGINLPANERDVTATRGSVRNINTVFKKQVCFNPNDILPTTLKETMIHDERLGQAQRLAGDIGGYITAPKYAKTTRKETTHSDYTSNPGIDQLGGGRGYLTAPTDLRYTNKENISVGRAPTQEKNKLSVGGDKINMKVDKLDGDRIVTREPQTTKVFNSIEQPQFCGQTSEGNKVSDAPLLAERINPQLLNAFKENPYTQSLSSFAAP
jgi:hypothetical protein